MSVNHFFFFVLKECLGESNALLFGSVFEGNLDAVFLDTVGPWVALTSVDDLPLKLM
jgi:hypothetical protein